MGNFYNMMGAPSPFDPSHRFVTSWILPPSVLFGIRALFAVYAFTCIFVRWGLVPSGVGSSFSYFTNITYWGLSFYFLITSFHGFCYIRNGDTLLNRWPRILQLLHSLFYTTVTVFPFIVTIVFWSILFSGSFESKYDCWSNVSIHGINSAWALFEIIFTRTESQPWLHIPFLVVMLGCYLGVAFITVDTEHFYVYNFLNPSKTSKGKTAGYIVGILIAAIVLFLVSKGLVCLRKWVTEEKLALRGKLSGKDVAGEQRVGDKA